MRNAFMLVILLAGSALASETIYKWTDAQGVVHYSDQPVPGAERIDLKAQTYSPTPVPASNYSPPPKKAAPAYQSLEISRPAAEETISNSNHVSIAVRVSPQLQPSDSLAVYMDGQRLENFPPQGQDLELQEVPRGAHTLVAAISDAQGNEIMRSAAVTFYVHQASIANPPGSANPNPRPRPH